MTPEIIDDIWIGIFEAIGDTVTLAAVSLRCQRFRDLALQPLLRNLRWSDNKGTSENLYLWENKYSHLTAISRTLVIQRCPFSEEQDIFSGDFEVLPTILLSDAVVLTFST
ncbi:hypothetical protein CPB83DRAFT_861013 [Crepidotus variabilis]|uniref:F-box domain-containing protein n=1 Tax=Crepidotus variabilis TaxID=179855 RepID=A0A9P6E8W9_9AGAR|nr:hypothetical protein CPB83DRAFT_861013 [Crepidotus variabilis]